MKKKPDYLIAAARALGRVKSAKKAHASRVNGRKGGRPKLSQTEGWVSVIRKGK